MAQATADPFDSLENMTESLADTDDLLSQMAGKEVDRLLAEKESESAGAAVEDIAPPPDEPEQAMSAQLDELFTELQSPAAPPPAPESKTEPLTQGPERAALLEAAGFDCPAAPLTSTDGDSQDPITEAAPQGLERSALLEAAGFQATDGSAPALGEQATPIDVGTHEVPANIALVPLPAYLKPLDWLSAPLDACPARVRQLLGPAAIITMINALAILTYVLMIRKH